MVTHVLAYYYLFASKLNVITVSDLNLHQQSITCLGFETKSGLTDDEADSDGSQPSAS